jgi:Holliday junction resolvasome RuvABC DNA-binding subunit
MMLRGHGDESIAHAAPRGPEADAVAALVGLGYSPAQASESVARAAHELGSVAIEVLIRESLRRLGTRS